MTDNPSSAQIALLDQRLAEAQSAYDHQLAVARQILGATATPEAALMALYTSLSRGEDWTMPGLRAGYAIGLMRLAQEAKAPGRPAKLMDLTEEVATTAGGTITKILEDPEAMAYLATRVVPDEEGITLADHVQCAKTDIDAYWEHLHLVQETIRDQEVKGPDVDHA